MGLIIDPEIKGLLRPHTQEESDALEALIVESRHIDPLVVLVIDGKKYLGDGYNRREIGDRHGIPYTTREITFNCRADAIQWVIDNQMGRRNLTKEERAYLIGKDYLNQKKDQGGDRRSSSRQNDDLKTTEKIAEKHDVSPKTVERDAKFAEAVDKLPEKEKATVLSGRSGETKETIAAGAKPQFCDRCRTGPVKDCSKCDEVRKKSERSTKPKPKKKKTGSETFYWRDYDTHLGKVIRGLDDLVNAYPEEKTSIDYKACENALENFTDAWKKWQKRLMGEKK